MTPLHAPSVEVGPTLIVTWGMVALLLAAVAVVALGFAWLIAWIVKRAVDANMTTVLKQLDRVVAVAESADGQYGSLRKRVEAVEGTAGAALDMAKRLDVDVAALKRRVGLPAV